MRNFGFRVIYYVISIFFAVTATPLLFAPSRTPLSRWIRLYTQTMLWCMRMIAGVQVTVRGLNRLPDGPCIIAAKHQSWGDGFCLFSQMDDLAFVTGDHLEKIPLLGGILRKLGAVIVNNCGGVAARARLLDNELLAARDEGRRILIYPEGHLAPVGRKYRYKRGVYHMYAAYGQPVAPVATNLGLYWPQASWDLKPGEAVLEVLDPIEPGLKKDEFMDRLERMIETRSLELLGDARPDGAAVDAPALPDPRQRLSAGA